MKYVVCVPDGCADEPVAELGGRTPLEAAVMPNLAKLAARGEVGRAAVIPSGLPPGSDVGNMSILGYDPAVYHTGRAPIEAAALGLRLAADQVAFRCNLVTVDEDGTMVDFAGGHPATADAARAIAALQAELGGSTPDGELSFHPGVQYRHIVVAPAEWGQADCVPPHDLSDQPVVWPTGPASGKLTDLMAASRAVLADPALADPALAGAALAGVALAANQVWLWGQGTQPRLPSFRATYGLDAALVTAVDLVRGLGVLTGIDRVEVPGATGWFDTDYEAKRDAALNALADGKDLFVIHVEATDEAGHAGNLEEKVRALEHWDARILAGLVDGLDSLGPWRLLLLPDHATPVATKTHSAEPVPYLLVDSAADGSGGQYSEPGVASAPVVAGHELMGRLVHPR